MAAEYWAYCYDVFIELFLQVYLQVSCLRHGDTDNLIKLTTTPGGVHSMFVGIFAYFMFAS
jgi:hypothetical protein